HTPSKVEAGCPATTASDMFSLGAVLYTMHVSRPGGSPEPSLPIAGALELPRGLDPPTANLLEALLAPAPGDRPSASDA
ncbi:unnamed protein product, partial [Discosporangium mesarthrocarpum]